MITRMVSIDASTKKTGVALFENAKLVEYQLLDNSKIIDKEDRTWKMANDIIDYLNKKNPDIVVIEDSWNAANVEVTKILTRIMGVTYGWCISNASTWYQFLPSQWRKLCRMEQGKKTRSELKQMSINLVKDMYNADVNDDVADAICIGLAYRTMTNAEDL